MTIEELNVIFTAKATDFKNKVKSTNKDLQDVAKATKKAGNDVDKGTALMNKAMNSIESKGAVSKLEKVNKKFKQTGQSAQEAGKDVKKSSGVISSAIKSIKIGIAVKAIEMALRAIKKLTDAYAQTQTAQSGLNSILIAQGKSAHLAKMWLADFTRDGLIPMTDAYAAYKNLASAGYSDKQTQSILQNLKDAAAYGRQGSLSMGEAVRSATEGIKNENSVLVDNAGVTKNLSVIWEEYADSIGKSVAHLTAEEKRIATVNGLMRETAYQTGNAAKFANSFAGAQAALKAQTKNLSSALGSIFAPALGAAIPYAANLISKLTILADKAGQVMNILFGTSSKSGDVNKTVNVQAQSANRISSSWNKAEKAVKSYQSRLLGVDVIHRLGSIEAPDNSSDFQENAAPASFGEFNTPFSNADNVIDPKIAERAESLRKKIDKIRTTFNKFAKPFKVQLKQIKEGASELYNEGVKPLIEAVFGLDWDKLAPDTYLAEFLGSSLKWALIDVSDALGFIAAVINGDFSDAWEHLKDLFYDNRVDHFNEKMDILKNKFDSVKEKVKETTESMKDKFNSAYEEISSKTEDFYNNKVAPWFTKEKWDAIFYNVGVSFGEKVNSCVYFWNETLPQWWERDVSPWFTKEKWEEKYSSMKTAFSEKLDQIEYTWNTKIVSWWNKKVSPWFTKEKWKTLGNNMKEGIVSGFEGAVNGLVGILNRGIGKLESWANNIISSINEMIDGFNSVSVIKANRLTPVTYKRIPAYKYGGFPEDGPFFMNRGELVGKFSNGKTAVANNMQIIEGIKGGVMQGVYEALSSYGFGSMSDVIKFLLDLTVRNEHGDIIAEIKDINMKSGRTVIAVDA